MLYICRSYDMRNELWNQQSFFENHSKLQDCPNFTVRRQKFRNSIKSRFSANFCKQIQTFLKDNLERGFEINGPFVSNWCHYCSWLLKKGELLTTFETSVFISDPYPVSILSRGFDNKYLSNTLPRKIMNLPYSIRMYWTNFWQPTVHVQIFFF